MTEINLVLLISNFISRVQVTDHNFQHGVFFKTFRVLIICICIQNNFVVLECIYFIGRRFLVFMIIPFVVL